MGENLSDSAAPGTLKTLTDERLESGSFNVIAAEYPATIKSDGISPENVAKDTLDKINAVLERKDYASLANFFTDASYWRDHLCLTWDFRTLHGPDKILNVLQKECRVTKLSLDTAAPHRAPQFAPLDGAGKVNTIMFFISVSTTVGEGRGLVRLTQSNGDWKVLTIYTSLKSLSGVNEPRGRHRPYGKERGDRAAGSKNWFEKRDTERNFEEDEPTVLIIGSGQGGLTAAARLKMVGIKSLMIDRNERVGDNWRKRYQSLVLHDPVWFDHLPYINFPDTWPIFTPKDKLADFFEAYVTLLELNVWTSTEMTSSSWDDSAKRWTVTVERKLGDKKETRTFHPRHIVQATGHSGMINFPTIKGMDQFQGRLCHSSQFDGAVPNSQGKRAVVIGSCNSGHDIAEDFFKAGYDVTMVQRSSTCVVSSETIVQTALHPLFSEDGPPVDDADIIMWGQPTAYHKAQSQELAVVQNERDRETLLGLQRAGFAVDSGPSRAGLIYKYYQRGGGYYIDVGASQLIIDGKIAIKHGQEVVEILKDGVKFADGSVLPADEIIFATGYQNMRTQARAMFGDQVADRLKDVWGFDEEGEFRAMWRPSGHPGFWYMGGNLPLCRLTYGQRLHLPAPSLWANESLFHTALIRLQSQFSKSCQSLIIMFDLNLLFTLSWITVCLQPCQAVTIPRHATAIEQRDVNVEYDFVIAGAGPAGLTVADRLTEDPSVTVLVIEAGPFDQYEDNVLVPGDYPPFQYFWPGLESEPQAGLDNISFSSVCGRVVGGGSAVNAMVYTRGSIEDYGAWGSLGNEGWEWDNLLPYFKKSENFTAPDPAYAAEANVSYADEVHGHSGPVQGSYPSYHFPGSENWWQAALNAGISQAPDPNAGDNRGVFYMSSFLDAANGTRSYARINHYDRVKEARSNYHILADTTVARVLFNGTEAIGVKYLPGAGGNVSQVTATKEVLLAAGGVHTPQVLQLSGIGPRARLEMLGVETVSDLPGVGQNLQDHATLTISYNFTNNVTPNQGSLDTNATYRAEQLELYEQQRLGAFTIVHPLSTNIASVALCNAASDCQRIIDTIAGQSPALYLPSDVDPTVLEGYQRQFEITLGQLNASSSPIGQIHWSTTTTATLYFVKPLSRGTINVNSTDPLANPVIDWRSMTNPADLDLTLALFRKHREIFDQPTMRELGPIELSPFGEAIQTNDDIKAVLRQQINPSNAHQCCTAAMLPRDLGGVVDDELRVYGVQRLRVIDISAWPMIISAAPTATIYGQGEKIADLIKSAYALA